MSKRKVTYRNYHADNLQKQKEETNKYRHSYLVALKLLLPSPHRTNCSSNWKHPLISCILPLKETASFRVVIGSHLRIIENGNNIIHRETVQTISIPKSCCVLFYHNRTIHGGGASMLGEPKVTRVFSVYGPPSMYEGIQNDNYGKDMTTCHVECEMCKKIRVLKEGNGGVIIDEKLNEYEKISDSIIINDYNLIDHGFCVLKVVATKELTKGIKNQIDMVSGIRKGIKWKSIGQEEIVMSGKREIMDIGGNLNPEGVFAKQVGGDLDKYIDHCKCSIESYLSDLFQAEYKEKGRTLLRNNGEIGNQRLHFDGKPNCNC